MEKARLGGHNGFANLFSELFILATHLKNSKDFGSPEVLRRQIIFMFDEADRQGRKAGFSAEVLGQARYAVTAFLDEMIMTSPWSHREQWSVNPLQYEFFKENVAGVGFFDRLDSIRREIPVNTELLEVYYLCLVLGFEGRYKIHERENLRLLVDKLSDQIRAAQGAMPTLSPDGRRPDELMEVVKRELPSWAVVTSGVAIIFFFYLALSFLITHDANQVSQGMIHFLEMNP